MTVGWLAGTHAVWETGGPSGEAERSVAWDLFAQVREYLLLPSTMEARSQWYRRGFAAVDGSYAAFYDGVGGAAGGVLLTIRQSVWERIGPEASHRLLLAITPGLHVSRLDLAADGPSSVLMTPANLYRLLPAARSRSRPGSRVLTVSWAADEKLTVGARSSARYLRVYLKGERVRHELELKQAVAAAAVERIRDGESLPSCWAVEYGRLVAWRL